MHSPFLNKVWWKMTSSCILTVNSMWNESKAVFLKKAKKKKSFSFTDSFTDVLTKVSVSYISS